MQMCETQAQANAIPTEKLDKKCEISTRITTVRSKGIQRVIQEAGGRD